MIQHFEPVIIIDGEFTDEMQAVDQYGYIDLRVVMATGVVPADIDGVPATYNGIDDPSSIMGMPDDTFSAIRASKALKSAGSDAAPSTKVAEGDA